MALADRHLSAIEVRLARVRQFLESQPAVEEAARELVRVAFELHQDTPRLHQLLTEEAPIPDPLRQRWLAIEVDLSTALKQFLVDSTEAQHVDCALAAHLSTTFIEAMAHKEVLYPPQSHSLSDVESACVQMLACYLRGTAPAC